MSIQLHQKVLELTKGKDLIFVEEIQPLWSGYGSLSRYQVVDGIANSVIVKHVSPPIDPQHKNGWNSSLSHERKLKSYQVELAWYASQSEREHSGFKIPKCYGTVQEGEEFVILLEDLSAVGYPVINPQLSVNTIEPCIKWLANFHARFLQQEVDGLWEYGTYWQLDQRPDELAALKDDQLKANASKIEFLLSSARYQTVVHGDAKVANFCFSQDLSQVAAVDFQYVGKGCGMKDLAYFLGSCLSEADCKRFETEVLAMYFGYLKEAILKFHPSINPLAVEIEWRSLFRLAWTDFHRFLKGWSPGHWKINSYSEEISREVLKKLNVYLDKVDLLELANEAELAALEAGALILKMRKGDLEISDKSSGSSMASRILTNADQASEKLIFEALSPTVKKFNLGWLAEESTDDLSRLEKEYFWCIDPLDGTLNYAQNQKGYSVSIGLVNKLGQSVLGVVYDPVSAELYSAVIGEGATRNGGKFTLEEPSAVFHLILDASIMDNPNEPRISQKFENLSKEMNAVEMRRVSFGGAVRNAIHSVFNQPSCYFKEIKKNQGGGSIWDFAATACIVEEAGGVVLNSNLEPLQLNDPTSTFMNRQGIFISSKFVLQHLPRDFKHEVTRCCLE